MRVSALLEQNAKNDGRRNPGRQNADAEGCTGPSTPTQPAVTADL